MCIRIQMYLFILSFKTFWPRVVCVKCAFELQLPDAIDAKPITMKSNVINSTKCQIRIKDQTGQQVGLGIHKT